MKSFYLLSAALITLSGAPRVAAQNGEAPLRIGDRVTITIGAIPDNEVTQIRGVYTIDDAGTVNLLHIGHVRAAGLKPSSLQRSIEQTYISQEIYTRPNVLVSTDNGAADSRQVLVTGVQKPGAIIFRQGMTLSQAIQSAGGPTAFGNMKKVKLIRSGRTPTIHNLRENFGNPAVDVVLQPDDQINVPE